MRKLGVWHAKPSFSRQKKSPSPHFSVGEGDLGGEGVCYWRKVMVGASGSGWTPLADLVGAGA